MLDSYYQAFFILGVTHFPFIGQRLRVGLFVPIFFMQPAKPLQKRISTAIPYACFSLNNSRLLIVKKTIIFLINDFCNKYFYIRITKIFQL